MTRIGTRYENSLHRDLKLSLFQPGDRMEETVDGYQIDLYRPPLLIEVQTRSFSSLKQKINRLLDAGHAVRLVYPVAVEKWLVRLADDLSTVEVRRRSPRKGGWEDVFSELVYLPEFLQHEQFELQILLTRQEEILCRTGAYNSTRRKSWRRKGWQIYDRSLLEITASRIIRTPQDLYLLLPSDMPAQFSTRELSRRLHRPLRLAQKMIYCLKKLDLILPAGKSGRTILYSLPTPDDGFST